MPISMECPSCMHTFELPEEMAGRKSKCPECKFTVFVVPRGPGSEDNSAATSSDLPPPAEPIEEAAVSKKKPASTMTSKPSSLKKTRPPVKKSTVTKTVKPTRDNPFEFNGKEPKRSPKRSQEAAGGSMLLTLLAVVGVIAVVLIGSAGVGAWYLWSQAKEQASLTEAGPRPPLKDPELKPEPKKIENKEPPKEEPSKPRQDPNTEPPKKNKPDPVPPMKAGRLLLVPFLPQNAKAGDRINLDVIIVREDCKGEVLLSFRTPAAGIRLNPAGLVPADADRVTIPVQLESDLPAGAYQLQVMATLDKLVENKTFDLTVTKPAPVVVKPTVPVTANGPLQITGIGISASGDVYTTRTGAMDSVALSPDKKWVASGGADGMLCLWDMEKQKLSTNLSKTNGSPVSALAFSPDGKSLAFGDSKGIVRLLDIEKKTSQVLQPGKVPAELARKENRIRGLEFAPKGDYLVAAGKAYLASWDLATSKQVAVAPIDAPSFHFGPNGENIFAINGKLITVIDPRRPMAPVSSLGKPTDLFATTFDFYGSKDEIIAVVVQDKLGELQRIIPKTGQVQKLAEFAEMNDVPTHVAVADKAGYVLTGDKQGVIRGFELDTGKQLFRFPGSKSQILGMAMSADGRRAVIGSVDGTIHVIDFRNEKPPQ